MTPKEQPQDQEVVDQAFRDYFALQIEQQKRLRAMPAQELAALSDRELYDAVRLRLLDEASTADEETEIPLPRQVMHVLVAFYDDFLSGGLCQFFAGASRVLAPDLCAVLEEVGAADHANLLDAFFNVHNIDPDNLDAFACSTLDEYLSLSQRYPFDNFDQAFEGLLKDKPLYRLCADYIRQHFSDFA